MSKAIIWLVVTITGLIGVVFFSYYLYDRLVLLPQDLEDIDRRYCSDPWYAASHDGSGRCNKFIAEHKDNTTWMKRYEEQLIHWTQICQDVGCG
jgi:hypothetical protein